MTYVLQTTLLIIKADLQLPHPILNDLDRLALVIAAYCHDLDHDGTLSCSQLPQQLLLPNTCQRSISACTACVVQPEDAIYCQLQCTLRALSSRILLRCTAAQQRCPATPMPVTHQPAKQLNGREMCRPHQLVPHQH